MQHITRYSNSDDKPNQSWCLKVVLQTEREVQFCLYIHVKLVLEKAEEPEIKLPTSAGSSKKQASSRKTSISAFIEYAKGYV